MRSMRTYRIAVVSAIVAACGLLPGCAKKDQPSETAELMVLCGSSFVEPMEKLCAEFTAETAIKTATSIGGSEDHLPHVKLHEKGDVYVTHDPYLDYTRDANALEDHVHVGFVAPVLAVQPGNPKGLKSIEDLTKPDLKVALTDPQFSTAGELVFALLEKKGIKGEVLKNVENRLTRGHGDLGNLLQTQTVDAVIMWNGVAHTFRDSLDVVKTPYEYDKEIRVHIIGLNYTEKPEALKQFMEFAKDRGQEIFADFGYVK
ncbi:MAG: substrate-binding domain-containing protein [Phycisphaerales bacterium]|nr:MAG: substrate-binding domain-containing protein [Phycisphaerales bacterium]